MDDAGTMKDGDGGTMKDDDAGTMKDEDAGTMKDGDAGIMKDGVSIRGSGVGVHPSLFLCLLALLSLLIYY